MYKTEIFFVCIKGGYDMYHGIEKTRFLKNMNGFSGGRTRTVSSGYTSDRDLDHMDEIVHVIIS